jgi:hypothetical protein
MGGMDDRQINAMALANGLDKALAEFPDDVRIAAKEAFSNAAKIEAPTDPVIEPWPAMRPGSGLRA